MKALLQAAYSLEQRDIRRKGGRGNVAKGEGEQMQLCLIAEALVIKGVRCFASLLFC